MDGGTDSRGIPNKGRGRRGAQSLTADLNTYLSSLDQVLAKNGQEFNLSPLKF